jgi:acyl-ACP thioesterase
MMAAVLTPGPQAGRVFLAERGVRTTDVTPSGRLRLDALARYLQDVAEDDVADSGWDEPCGWLLRKCAVSLRRWPMHGDPVQLRTYCSGLGPRWAERTTSVSSEGECLISARAVWVAADPSSGAPVPLSERFRQVYGPSADGRTVSARLSLPGPDPAQLPGRPWPLRASDFDTAGHVGNAVYWIAAEDSLAARDWLPASAEMEYRLPILPGCEPRLVTRPSPGALDLWLLADDGICASARLALRS